MSSAKSPIRSFSKAAHVGRTNRAGAASEAPTPAPPARSLLRQGSADELGAVLAAAPSRTPAASGAGAVRLRQVDTVLDLAAVAVGETVLVNTQLIHDNPDNAREFYRHSEVDATGQSLQKNQQDVAANGWIEGGGLLLRDGGKRLRGARAVSVTHLEVKIVERPANRLDAWLASRRMNIERSTHTVYDDAIRFRQYLDSGEVKSQAELAAMISDPGEPPKSAGYVSQIVAISAIPRSIASRLVETTALCTKNAAWEISRLFTSEGLQRLASANPELGTDAGAIAAERVTEQIIAAATANKEMTSSDVRAIVQRALGEATRAPRAKSVAEPVSLATWNARMTSIPQHKLLRVEFHDVPEDQMDTLRSKLKSLFEAAKKGGNASTAN